MESAVITTAMLTPLTTMISSNVGVILPVGITIMGLLIGVGLIPRLIYKFL